MATTTRIGTTAGEYPVISANGRFVAYESDQLDEVRHFPGYKNNAQDV